MNLKGIKNQRDFPPCTCRGQEGGCSFILSCHLFGRAKPLPPRVSSAGPGIAISKTILKAKDGPGCDKLLFSVQFS